MDRLYFPMDTLRITQGYGVDAASYSHAGSYALDLGGADTGRDWLVAPCDLVVQRVYGNYNAVWFESLDPLDSIGTTVVLLCLHINNVDKQTLGLRVGQVIRAGQRMYREGTAGNVTGAHVHMEVGRGPFTGNGWRQNAQGTWCINNQLIPHEVFTLKKDCRVLADGGYKWKTEDENHMMQFYEVYGEKNCQAFTAADVDAVSEDYPIGKLPLGYYPVMADAGTDKEGLHWYRIYAGGKQRYAVLLDDRSRLVELSAGDAVPAVLAQAPAADSVQIEALQGQLDMQAAAIREALHRIQQAQSTLQGVG